MTNMFLTFNTILSYDVEIKCASWIEWHYSIKVLPDSFTNLPGSCDTTHWTRQSDLLTTSQTRLISISDFKLSGTPSIQHSLSGHFPTTSGRSYPSLCANCSSVSSEAMLDTPTCTTNWKKEHWWIRSRQSNMFSSASNSPFLTWVTFQSSFTMNFSSDLFKLYSVASYFTRVLLLHHEEVIKGKELSL